MAPPDPRDDEFIKQVAADVAGLIVAVHRGTPEQVMGHVALLLSAICEHKKAMAERPSDEPLRRAVALMG